MEKLGAFLTNRLESRMMLLEFPFISVDGVPIAQKWAVFDHRLGPYWGKRSAPAWSSLITSRDDLGRQMQS
jgi:hypothetical protein